jgi:ADP-ribose pyrophosphatase YjhB (NUDIX family)
VNLQQATLTFLIKDSKVLLGMKKRGFGKGKWNGFGGKPEAGESVEDAAIRETKEESQVLSLNLKQVGVIDFIFHGKAVTSWSERVTIFITDQWKGEPGETEEMKPAWFRFSEIPYEAMWEDDKHWLPLILKGEKVSGVFNFDENSKLVDFKITHSKGL